MVKQGANLDPRAISSLTTKLMDAQFLDEVQYLTALIDDSMGDRFPLNFIVEKLNSTGKLQEALDLVGMGLTKVPFAKRDWRLYLAHFTTLSKLGNYDTVFELHEDVMQSGTPVGTKYFAYLIAILGLQWWLRYIDALSYVFDGESARSKKVAAAQFKALFTELRCTHLELMNHPARRDWVQHHSTCQYLTLLIDSLKHAGRLDLALALWDEYVLRVVPRNDSLEQDPVWRIGKLTAALVPNGAMQSVIVDVIGRFGDIATLADLETTLFKHAMDSNASWPIDANVFTSLIEAHFRLGNPDGACRVLLRDFPRKGLDSDSKLRGTFYTQARVHGYLGSVLKKPDIRRALFFGPFPE
ncbi:hypothetical protein GGF32_003919 [Allomyces javanicus]|nr:hypothetical protein GGF32_003919 [Allomyces javanicus]